jgi:hypothetical protein
VREMEDEKGWEWMKGGKERGEVNDTSIIIMSNSSSNIIGV